MNLVLVGPPDRGKSTLARALAERAARRFGRAWLLDLDVGQGSLPGTVARFRVEAAGWRLERRVLVGRITPVGAEGWLLAASARLARAARGPWVADTDGWADGAAARQLRAQQIDVLGARQVGVLGDRDLYESLAWRRDLDVRWLRSPAGVQLKTPQERAQNRERRLQAHLRGAVVRWLPAPPAEPGYLFALLDGAGFFVAYAVLLERRGPVGRFATPARGPVARVVPTWVTVPAGFVW